jgi:hypothetical protein
MDSAPDTEPRARASRAAVVALNLLVLSVFAWAVEHWWGWARLLAPWGTLPGAELALAVSGMLASYALRALRIYLAERAIPRDALFACLRLILLNNALNLLLPARSGEASFPILMSRWFGVDPARATGTLLWLRLLDLHVLATVGAVCAAAGWLASDHAGSVLAHVAAGLAAAGPLLLFLLRSRLVQLAGRGNGKPPRLLARALDGVPQRPAWLALDLVLSWSAWSVKLAALGWVLSRLAQLSPVLGTLGAIGGDLSTVLPLHAPGGFGTYEAGVMALLAPGIDAHSAQWATLLAAAVNLHLLVLTTALLGGAAAWLAGMARAPDKIANSPKASPP